MTRARDVASALSGALSSSDTVSQTLSNKTIDGNDNTITTKRGGTSSRPSTPTTGTLYYNTDDDKLQIYDAGWTNVYQAPAIILSGISPSTAGTTGTSITITGSYIQTGATVKFIGTDNTERSAASVSVTSATQVVATTPSLPVTYEPYDVKVTNPDGQNATLSDALDAGGTPTWNTASGTLTTINEQTSLSTSVSATDPDGTSIVYSSSDLPAWISLNSSTGSLTGTAPDIASNTTYNFNITATDGVNSSSRAFAVVVNYVVPQTTTINFASTSDVTSRSSYTGQDGVTRTYGQCGPGGNPYHGVLFDKYFPANKNFELILRLQNNTNNTQNLSAQTYVGIGYAYGTGYSDSTATGINATYWYGGSDPFTNIPNGTKNYNYYNTSGEAPPFNAGYPLYLKFVRSGSSFNIYYSNSYSNISNQVGQINLPSSVNNQDIVLVVGEAQDAEYMYIEKFVMDA